MLKNSAIYSIVIAQLHPKFRLPCFDVVPCFDNLLETNLSVLDKLLE